MPSRMRLNNLSPGEGAKRARTRVGRGIGSGLGKTCGRGHKGQHSRSGGYHKVGFEGGQQPLQRRLPKVGFSSRVGRVTAEIRLSEFTKIDGDIVDLTSLRAANLITAGILRARVMLSGTIDKIYTVKGLAVTKGARAAIEAAGGKIED